jgi:RNA polymerase sigma-B factor
MSSLLDRNAVPPESPDGPSDAELIGIVQSQPLGSGEREAACAELVRRYQSLVFSCAARYLHSPEPQDELVQAGYVGLLSAINHFDPQYGTSLAAYARPCISGEIKRHFRDKRWQVHVRRAAQELRAEILACESYLTQQLHRAPTEQEVAEHLGREVSDVREGHNADRAFQALSLNAPFSADADAGTLGDLLGDDDDEALGTAVDMEAVWAHIGELPEREQTIVTMRFYGNMTQAQIGEQLGISQMHVSRLLAHALRFLRERLGD